MTRRMRGRCGNGSEVTQAADGEDASDMWWNRLEDEPPDRFEAAGDVGERREARCAHQGDGTYIEADEQVPGAHKAIENRAQRGRGGDVELASDPRHRPLTLERDIDAEVGRPREAERDRFSADVRQRGSLRHVGLPRLDVTLVTPVEDPSLSKAVACLARPRSVCW